MSLKVGLNLAFLVEDSGGSGTYARQLMPHLMLAEPALELTAWIGTTAPAWLEREPWAAEVRWVRLPVPGIGTPWHLWHELFGIGLDASRRRIDLVHGLAFLAPLTAPGVATVVTIHDVIWMHHPETAGPRFHLVMRTLTPAVGRRCSRIIAISRAARDDVAQTLHLPVEKFDVAPHGIVPIDTSAASADPAEVRGRLDLGPERIVLCVAAKRPHKNLHGLIEGFAALARAGGEPLQLVLPGSPNEYERQLRELAGRLGVAERVRFPGWVSDEDLEALYAAACCFVLPSFEEGFGMPVLEAMERGLPVACSEIPALVEVAGDAALMFDPADPESIAGALARITGDPGVAADLIERGRERCGAFTWERAAEATLDSYRRALRR